MLADLNAKLLLKGGLNRYTEDKVKEIVVSDQGKTIKDVLEEYKVPLDQVQLVVLNGTTTKNLEPHFKDGDEVTVIPIIESG